MGSGMDDGLGSGTHVAHQCWIRGVGGVSLAAGGADTFRTLVGLDNLFMLGGYFGSDNGTVVV